MTRSLGLLMIGTLGLWLVLALILWLALPSPDWLQWGESTVLFSGTAGLLCLVPTALTLVWTRFSFHGQPEQQLLAVLGGTGVRMAFVIGMGMVFYHLVPRYQHQQFWIWVIVFYLYTLALEVILLTRHMSREQVQKN